MAKQVINIGDVANDGTGDRPRTAGQKINSNFTELYNWARERVSSNRTYYVATTGNDSNSGLGPGVAMLTIQHAIDVITNTLSIDQGVVVTIQVANGSYTISNDITLNEYTGPGSVQIIGNQGTPGSVIIQTSSAQAIFASSTWRPYYLSGFRLQASSGSPFGLAAASGFIQFDTIEFNTGLGTHIYANNGGLIQSMGSYTVIGSANAHIAVERNGTVMLGGTVTVTSTPSFATAFVQALTVSLVAIYPSSFSGSATGKRYQADSNSVIDTGGGGASFIPGNVSGTTATGGQYV